MYGIGEVVIPAKEGYVFTMSVPMEMAHFFQKGRNIKEVKESMSLSTTAFKQKSYFEHVKKAMNCASSCNACFKGIYEEGNQLKVNLNFPTCEGVWNFAVQLVSVV